MGEREETSSPVKKEKKKIRVFRWEKQEKRNKRVYRLKNKQRERFLEKKEGGRECVRVVTLAREKCKRSNQRKEGYNWK